MPETATDQLKGVLSAIERTESNVHAYRHVLAAQAGQTATELDAQNPRSPIHGWPFAVKEVFDVAGTPTSGGCRAFADRTPAKDAEVVARLHDAGAVLVGTQIAHELTCGADEPPTRNPWDTTRYPGGSSAGAGVSVAVGSARFALGTDAAGSVRIPAAMTGTTGLKPTRGRVSASGIFARASAPSLDNVGIISRSASDVFAVLKEIEGADAKDERTLNRAQQALGLCEAIDLEGRRIAVLGPETVALLDGVYPRERDVIDAFDAACEVFRSDGARLTEIEVTSLGDAITAAVTLFSTELAAANRDAIKEKRDLYFPAVADLIESALSPDRDALADAVETRTRIRADLDEVLAGSGFDVLLTPTTPRVAMELASFDPDSDLGTVIPYTCAFNLTGHPALSVPCGFSTDRLPIGLQIVGGFGRDGDVLRYGNQFQSMTTWHLEKPPI